MPVRYALKQVNLEYDEYLQGLTVRTEFALWLGADIPDLNPVEMTVLVEAFSPLRGIFWQAEESFQKDEKSFPVLENAIATGTMVSKTKTTLFSTDKVQTSNIIWYPPAGGYRLMELLGHVSGGNWYVWGLMSFIPNDLFSGDRWAKITQCADWLRICRQWIGDSPKPSLDAHAATLSYINMTYDMMGVPGLVWLNADLATGLVFFGQESLLNVVAKKLESSPHFVDDSNLYDHVVRRGAHFDICF
jgi:hypothetical protein